MIFLSMILFSYCCYYLHMTVSVSVPCHIPSIEYGIYTMSPNSAIPSNPVSLLPLGVSSGDEKELNETDPIPNGQVVHFSCEYGYLLFFTFLCFNFKQH